MRLGPSFVCARTLASIAQDTAAMAIEAGVAAPGSNSQAWLQWQAQLQVPDQVQAGARHARREIRDEQMMMSVSAQGLGFQLVRPLDLMR